MSEKKIERMERLLKASGGWLEPNKYYPDPLNDLDDETFQLYIDALEERKEYYKKIERLYKMLITAIQPMANKAYELNEDFNFLINKASDHLEKTDKIKKTKEEEPQSKEEGKELGDW